MKTIARCLLPVLIIMLIGVPTFSLLAAPADPVASLDPVQGFIQYQAQDADPTVLAEWDTVTQRMLVSEGDRIRTDAAGRAVLTFFTGAEAEIGPSTLAVVSTLDLPDAADPSFNITLDVLIGHTITNIDATLDPGDRFEVHTPGATAVVRGTRWWTLVTPLGFSFFAAKEGTFSLVPSDPALPARTITAPQKAQASRSGQSVDVFDELDISITDPAPAPLALPTCGNGVCDPDEAGTCKVDCPYQFPLPACGDGECRLDQGEDLIICPADCAPFPGEACGSGSCDADESGITCPADCAPGDYFAPVHAAACGNGSCDTTESALNCPADCVPVGTFGTETTGAASGSTGGGDGGGDGDTTPPDQSGQPEQPGTVPYNPAYCQVTGDYINLRERASTHSVIMGRLYPGNYLDVIGQSIDGSWYAVLLGYKQFWVASWVVTTSGPCDDLVVLREDPAAATTVTGDSGDTSPDTVPGTWGACGSCADCGPYPSSECMSDPDGQCVWNPAACRAPGGDGDGDIEYTAVLVPEMSVYNCASGSSFSANVHYQTDTDAVLVDWGASSGDDSVARAAVEERGSTSIQIRVTCIGQQGSRTMIFATATDSDGRALATQFGVSVGPQSVE